MTTTTRTATLEALAERAGVDVRSYSPGDGVTRYRFFPRDSGNGYFGPANGLDTVLGLKAAVAWLEAFAAGRANH